MTAIAGLWRRDGRPDTADGCQRMLGALQMYGRDGSRSWTGGEIALGTAFSRLLPEDAHDRQPLRGGTSLVLVADLRLDNREELATALDISTEHLHSLSDTNVLFAAYRKWELNCFNRLVGDYAFALWDGEHRRLILARDPLGMRPLYYHTTERLFAFASMPKGLHALPEIPYAANEEQIAEFLALMPDRGSATYFKGVEKIEAGHYAIITTARMITARHWEPKRVTSRLSPQIYEEGLRERFDEAVRCRLRGVSEVAAHLSSGYDSSAVAATAAHLLAPSGGRVHAFTSVPRLGYLGAAPRGRIGDEGALASLTAAMYPNMEHSLIRTEGRSPLDNLERNFLLYDQPMLNLCNLVWSDKIHDAARQRGLRVLLTGNLGNMTLSYSGNELLAELLRSGRLLQWFREIRALHRKQRSWRGLMAQSFGPWVPGPLWRFALRSIGSSDYDMQTYTALRPERLEELNIRALSRERDLDLAYRPWKDGFAMRVWAVSRGNRGAVQKGVLAGWNIDLRDPTSDRRLFEFCLATPTDQFLRNGVSRSLARRVLADRLPAQVLDAPGRGYQAVDWHEGLTSVRDKLANEIGRLKACPPATRALATERMQQLVENWPKSGWERPAVYEPYRLALLRGISAGHFLRRTAGTND